jgi:small redox-active disulfide protein 2
MNIKVLGAGCHNCRVFENAVQETLAEMKIEANVEEVENITEIMSYGILHTPGLVIDGKVVLSGKIPTNKEIKDIIKNSIRNEETKVKFSSNQEQIARIGLAFSHPARIFILETLNSMHTCCTSCDSIGETPIDHDTLHEHLKILKGAGLIQGEINPPKINFCINRINLEIAKILITNFLK